MAAGEATAEQLLKQPLVRWSRCCCCAAEAVEGGGAAAKLMDEAPEPAVETPPDRKRCVRTTIASARGLEVDVKANIGLGLPVADGEDHTAIGSFFCLHRQCHSASQFVAWTS